MGNILGLANLREQLAQPRPDLIPFISQSVHVEFCNLRNSPKTVDSCVCFGSEYFLTALLAKTVYEIDETLAIELCSLSEHFFYCLL